ncbi:bromodomain adjacent to zinc finger domain protein 1A isoform X2 [Aricia agestis]|uniref:bromodomain adjacent to zinc finger domain protein 1A isoform X2 n=1 Tax=Aricia agestis TaxID=91739 RepID=UPI001C205380|nr:bromodomain adjacent to zinc finger domain protein 1A isoform X2 [Aricia agestis]
MPLLKRKAFEKSSASEYLRDDDEVFHCEITDEIFKDYEEYCERIILVNSMVWTCEMTGKNNLTYAEALDSEKAARRSLKDFPMELRIPILYLATKTKRSSFAEMSEDIFNYVRERYFVGETVEACLEGDTWLEAHILSVTAQKQHPDNQSMLPPSAYCYEVEQYDDSDPATPGQIGTAPFDRIRRRKGIYSREKNKLFLKQFVTQVSNIIGIKQAAIEKYNIAKVNFDQIFTGNPPDFPSSKKLLKPSLSPHASKMPNKPNSATKNNKFKKPSPDKKGQQSMDKFVKKTDKSEVSKMKTPMDPEARKSAQELANKMRRAEDQMRQRKEEEKAKKKEKNAQLMAFMKEWQKVKDDQELEDHKIIPKGTPIQVEGIPHQNFGDFLSVLEFVYNFSDTLKVKDVFHNDLDAESLKKSLTSKEYAWMFSELIQMFLSAIFSLQEDEAEEYNEHGNIKEYVEDKDIDENITIYKSIELATKASKWSHTYLGSSLSKLPLDPTTVTEVLRLHLLASGGTGGSRAAAWRAQQRGGYGGGDDPAARLRLTHPQLLARLRRAHVADLDMDDKFMILQCLMNQVLSYANVRDLVEEKLEEYKNLKHQLRTLQINERKREPQLATARMELKRTHMAKKEELKLSNAEFKVVEAQLKDALEELNRENEAKKVENEKKIKELQAQIFNHINYVGSDRAFQRYWVSRRVPGLFVEAGAEPRGPCRRKPLPAPPAPRADLLSYIADLADRADIDKEPAGSDKENESAANSRGNSPKKPLSSVNGLSKVNGVEPSLQHMRDLLICTADINTCYVHGKGDYRPQWWVYHTEEQVEGLIAALNKRGAREADLRHTLELDRAKLVDYIKKCPLHVLNPSMAAPMPANSHATRRRWQPSLTVPRDATLAETLELTLRDHILELEEKIFHGCLGAIKVKDREAWRGTIMVRGYDKQAEYLSWGPGGRYRDDVHLHDGVLNVPSDLPESEVDDIPENRYRDPGQYLERAVEGGGAQEAGPPASVVRGLACALLQVAQAIHHKYLKRPLGLDDKERKEREAKGKGMELEAMERWEVSLMECRGLAALQLHLLALDGSVAWASSILNASCRVCRRKADPDNMLLCDGCNKGHHLYCLKPKLNKVPEGDWFCQSCKPKEKTPPRQRRKLYTEVKEEEESEEESEPESFSTDDVSVCGACGSGGRLAGECGGCGARYHAECCEPRLTRAARKWMCAACLAPPRDSSDSESNTPLQKMKGRKSRNSKESSPMTNGSATKRGRKPKAEINGHSTRKSKSLTNGTSERRRRTEEPLHVESLQQLLQDAEKHRDSWPFCEPVSVEDVPDYLDVIEKPMDFSTVRSKLAAREYGTDEEALADIALIFNNCYTYNKDTHPVAKAGCRLEKYIIKRCAELKLPPMPETILEEEETGTKRPLEDDDDDDDAPLIKRSRHN